MGTDLDRVVTPERKIEDQVCIRHRLPLRPTVTDKWGTRTAPCGCTLFAAYYAGANP